MKASEVKRLPKTQFLYLLRAAPAQARYIALVCSSRVAAAKRQQRAARNWSKLLAKLPLQFSYREFQDVGGDANLRDTLRRNGVISRVPGSTHFRSVYLLNSPRLNYLLNPPILRRKD